MTRRTKGLMKIRPHETIEINPGDARRLGVADGDWVRVSSRRGGVKVRAEVTARSRKGNAFMSFHFDKTLTNILTSEGVDALAGTPEYKVSAINIKKL